MAWHPFIWETDERPPPNQFMLNKHGRGQYVFYVSIGYSIASLLKSLGPTLPSPDSRKRALLVVTFNQSDAILRDVAMVAI